jgi:glycosyltransferase involved in cell wall biosynthesis
MVDMIVDEKSGLLVYPGDERELAIALKRVVADEGLRRLIGIGAQERVRIFTSSRVVERLEAVYEQVAPRSPTAPGYRFRQTMQNDNVSPTAEKL